MEKSFKVTSFLTYDEVDMLLKFYSILPKTLNQGGDKKAYTTGFDLDKTPITNFHERLKNIFGNYKTTVSMFLEEFEPWAVHSDYFKQDTTPYYAFLIPLDHQDKDTHTIIFDELGNTADWKDRLTPDSNYRYNNEESRLLNHIDETMLKKLTIHKVHKWRKGDLISWHRNLLHSSDNFFNAGLKKKIALVVFLNRDD
tara:strand:+ start:406 stop:999 length:594 start_codon:yes stop_codon:yes gene_type:complete